MANQLNLAWNTDSNIATIIMSGGLTIDDVDIGELSFQPATMTGVYGNFVIEASGDWTYSADNNQVEIQELDQGQTLAETLTVSTFDGTTHTVKIEIIGTEDAAVISGVTEGAS
jgi:VCBS repeat-containing protein